MEIKVNYTKEDGFTFSSEKPNSMQGDEFYPTALAMASYALCVLAIMKGDGNSANARMILEYAINNSRAMLKDSVIFCAIKKGIEEAEKGMKSHDVRVDELASEVVQSDTQR